MWPHQLTWPGGYSPVEWDHRAFTARADTGQFFLPAEIYDFGEWEYDGEDDEVCAEPEPQDEFGGVVTGTIDGDALTQGPRLPSTDSGRSWSPPADRTLVIDGNPWTVHAEGMNRYDLKTLDGGPALMCGSADSPSLWSN